MDWIRNRLLEPSSYAAIATIMIGISVIVDSGFIAILGTLTAIAGVVLKEKGII
jgi:hypothetical protein